MSRVNWRERLSRFAAEWKRTDISAKDWCDREGYSWGTAKAYISIKAAKLLLAGEGEKIANSGKISPKKTANSRIAKQVKKTSISDVRGSKSESDNDTGKIVEIAFNPSEYGLSEQQEIFVVEYLRTQDKYAAYKNAKYKCEGDSWQRAARRLYRNVPVYRAIRAGIEARQKRYDAELDEIIHQLVSIAKADPNDLVQFRRVNCRYCWGEGHKYQWRDFDEQLKAEKKAEADNKSPPDLSGGIGFVSNDEPNPECPRCNGEGEGEVHVTDTTHLIGTDARWLYAGIKQTQHGIQVMTADQDAARRNLVQLLTAQRAGGSSGDRPPANSYTSDDYRAAASSLDDEFGDLD